MCIMFLLLSSNGICIIQVILEQIQAFLQVFLNFYNKFIFTYNNNYVYVHVMLNSKKDEYL